jgi:acetyl-CoA synthetase
MSEKVYDVPAEWRKRAFVDDAKYKEMYDRSIKDPNGFWAEHAKRVDWIKPFTKVKNTSYDPHSVSIKWFEDGTLNVCHNCVDRHLAKRGDQTAFCGKAMIQRTTRKSLTSSCTPRCAVSPTC